MARARVVINKAEVKALEGSADVGRAMVKMLQPALETAEATAPVRTGTYVGSLRVEEYDDQGRAGARLVAGVDYAVFVEAEHGVLARSIDSVQAP